MDLAGTLTLKSVPPTDAFVVCSVLALDWNSRTTHYDADRKGFPTGPFLGPRSRVALLSDPRPSAPSSCHLDRLGRHLVAQK